MSKKQCRVCNEVKLLVEFTKDSTKKDGHHNNCKECNKEKMRLWRINHPGYDRKHDETRRAGYDQNYHNEYQRKRRENNPEYRLMGSIRSRISKFLRQKGFQKKSNTYEIVACSPEELRNWIESQWTEGMNWDNYGNKKGCWNIDHIKPLGVTETLEEIYEVNHYTNLQPLWWDENIRKSNKWLEE